MGSISKKQSHSGSSHGYGGHDSGYGGYGGSSGYGGYGSGYGGYGYGYGYGGYGSGSREGGGGMQRSFQDYMLILRERIWYIIVVFLVVFASSLVYTLSQTKIYQATTSLQILRREKKVMPGEEIIENVIASPEDLNTVVKLIESGIIIQKVSDRITGDDLRRFMAPYEKGGSGDPVSPMEILGENRKVVPQRLSLLIWVQYRHPDREIAAKVTNIFAEEFISYNFKTRIEESLKAVEDLKERAAIQEKKVNDIALDLQKYREEKKMPSLDDRKNLVLEKLKTLSQQEINTQLILTNADIHWKQVKERVDNGKDLQDIPFIPNHALIDSLASGIASKKIAIALYANRYRPLHPTMIALNDELAQAEKELAKATVNAAASIQNEYDSALKNNQETKVAKEAAQLEAMELDRAAVDYDARTRELFTQQQVLQGIIQKEQQTNLGGGIESTQTRIIDKAVAPMDGDYVAPNMMLNLGLGFIGGIGLGFAFAFFVAFIDDRVKSSFDIESVVGLPLIGIIPQIKKMEQPDKAQIVFNNADRQVSESFLTLHSGLRLKDESKNAQCILITSTIPGEGKSFTTTNLALTYAAHGERVLIIDCDLRKPNIHKSFRLENLKGVIDICAGAATIDDVVIKGVHPNLDIIPSGGRAKNPTQILNSKNFEIMISDLRKRYDRIMFDTPPLAAVSDALIVLPLVDGSIFTIFFNKVRRKAAQFAAKKLLEGNVPVYGAVLNGLNLSVSGYYYAQYYDKSYKDYYVVMSKGDNTPQR